MKGDDEISHVEDLEELDEWLSAKRQEIFQKGHDIGYESGRKSLISENVRAVALVLYAIIITPIIFDYRAEAFVEITLYYLFFAVLIKTVYESVLKYDGNF